MIERRSKIRRQDSPYQPRRLPKRPIKPPKPGGYGNTPPKHKRPSPVTVTNGASSSPILTVSNGGSVSLSQSSINSKKIEVNTDLAVDGNMIVTGSLIVTGTISLNESEEPLGLENALQTAEIVLNTEKTARIQAKIKPALIEKLESLKYDKTWLDYQEDPERAQLEVEKIIRKLKGICLEDSLGDLLED